MPFAITHVLIAIILIDLFRKFVIKKENFPLYLVLIGGIFGLLPDIDIPIAWILGIDPGNIHQVYTHNFLIPFLILLCAVALWNYKKEAHILLVASAGWTIHTLLDSIFTSTYLLFPFSTNEFGLHLTTIFLPANILGTFYMGMDAIILIIWLLYESKKGNIKDYI
jgi:hypothetical protein